MQHCAYNLDLGPSSSFFSSRKSESVRSVQLLFRTLSEGSSYPESFKLTKSVPAKPPKKKQTREEDTDQDTGWLGESKAIQEKLSCLHASKSMRTDRSQNHHLPPSSSVKRRNGQSQHGGLWLGMDADAMQNEGRHEIEFGSQSKLKISADRDKSS